jgi:hypothetical protein
VLEVDFDLKPDFHHDAGAHAEVQAKAAMVRQ